MRRGWASRYGSKLRPEPRNSASRDGSRFRRQSWARPGCRLACAQRTIWSTPLHDLIAPARTRVNVSASIATLFGIGRVRTAPGTAASLVALPVAFGLATVGGRVSVLLAAVFVTALGGWACEHYVRETGTKDPPECVVDELAGQLLALSFAPRGILAYVLAFALFRALDIWKPGPIAAAERLPGGLGVMADDVLAGLLAGLVVAVFAHAGLV